MLLLFGSLLVGAALDGNWSCAELSSKPLAPGGVVTWARYSCSGLLPPGALGHRKPVGPMVFNVVTAQMDAPGVGALPVAAPQLASLPSAQRLQTLPELAATGAEQQRNSSSSSSSSSSILAGINGGYFWRVDEGGIWVDDVCWGKGRREALRNASATDANAGVGDCAHVVDGVTLASNCDHVGYSRPTALVLRERAPPVVATPTTAGAAAAVVPRIELLRRGERLDASVVLDAIGAGPQLVATDAATGAAAVDIPADDDNVNVRGRESSTAVGLRYRSATGGGDGLRQMVHEMLLVTADGSDSCKAADPTCGIEFAPFAGLLLEYFGVYSAMGMDRGGSSTMWVNGSGAPDGVVSNPGHGPRRIFNGLFVTFDP